MGSNLHNSEGYLDLTAHEAMTDIEREKKKNKPIVFICSPFAGDIAGNTERAKRYGRFAVSEKVVPIIPHLMYPQFLFEDDPAERKLGIEMGLVLLAICRELWVFGKQISQGMAIEINQAKKHNIPIRHFTIHCKPDGWGQMMSKKECFAYQRGRCKALTVTKCQGPECSFFKTKAQLEEERQKVFQHIQSLDESTRRYIIDTYYGGKMKIY